MWRCAGELKGLLVGLSLATDGSGGLDTELAYWMKEMDMDRSGSIDYNEFSRMLQRCASLPTGSEGVIPCSLAPPVRQCRNISVQRTALRPQIIQLAPLQAS